MKNEKLENELTEIEELALRILEKVRKLEAGTKQTNFNRVL